jgi:hypothetical protein
MNIIEVIEAHIAARPKLPTEGWQALPMFTEQAMLAYTMRESQILQDIENAQAQMSAEEVRKTALALATITVREASRLYPELAKYLPITMSNWNPAMKMAYELYAHNVYNAIDAATIERSPNLRLIAISALAQASWS